mmetsp:Transcript_148001/g.258088  ORF Transcript_148001/g.258088 Transcript_148001/m.258088 type:complete len:340 (-) Transcript_148001:111-1130(-)
MRCRVIFITIVTSLLLDALSSYAVSRPNREGTSFIQVRASGTNVMAHNSSSAHDVPLHELRDGQRMPVLGLGTAGGSYEAVRMALRLGYRMFDTAQLYGTEEAVGQAIRDSGVPRSDIFVTTKIMDSEHGYWPAFHAGSESNNKLGLGYIDLLLIHSPDTGKIVETYDALLKLQKDGIVRSVGVSNFGISHLKALEKYCRPMPVLNQFELHPLIFSERQELIEYCEAKQIMVQAYASIFLGNTDLIALANETAKPHHKTAAQALLRWALDQRYAVIPKSVHQERLAENIDVFDFHLSNDEIGGLSKLSSEKTRQIYGERNPNTTPVDVGHFQRLESCTH